MPKFLFDLIKISEQVKQLWTKIVYILVITANQNGQITEHCLVEFSNNLHMEWIFEFWILLESGLICRKKVISWKKKKYVLNCMGSCFQLIAPSGID